MRTVALFEAAKGDIVLATGVGALELLGRDAQASAEALVRQLHLYPASHYPRIFQLLAQQATPAHLWALAAGAVIYAVVRFIEAYGLWRGRAWAEWFAVLSGGIYLPFEFWCVIHHATWAREMVLTVNLAIVGILGGMLAKSHDKSTLP